MWFAELGPKSANEWTSWEVIDKTTGSSSPALTRDSNDGTAHWSIIASHPRTGSTASIPRQQGPKNARQGSRGPPFGAGSATQVTTVVLGLNWSTESRRAPRWQVQNWARQQLAVESRHDGAAWGTWPMAAQRRNTTTGCMTRTGQRKMRAKRGSCENAWFAAAGSGAGQDWAATMHHALAARYGAGAVQRT